MNFEEFKDYFWAYIPTNIMSFSDRNVEHKDFYDSVCYDCYRLYSQSQVDIDTICKVAESVLFNVYRFKPILGMQ